MGSGGDLGSKSCSGETIAESSLLSSEEKHQDPARRRNRPGRAQRERQRNKNTSEATSTPALSNLNPSAAEFIPQQVVPVFSASNVENSEARQTRGKPRRGARGGAHPHPRPTKSKENVRDSSSRENHSRQGHSRHPPRIRPHVPPVPKESEDLMLRMTESLTKGDYDCSICTDSVCSLFCLADGRYNGGNRFGRVKSAGQSFTHLVSKNGRLTYLARDQYGGVRGVKIQVRRSRVSIVVGVERWRIQRWID
jgi:hypothetical protein